MLELTLARHGETIENRERILQGQNPRRGRLTSHGMAQARALGKALREECFDQVYCSPLERAVITLGLALAERSTEGTLPLAFEDDLKEIDMGQLDGQPGAEWERLARQHGDPMTYGAPRGESWSDVGRRAESFLRERLLGRSRRVLVVAHGGLNRALISAARGTPLGQAWRPSEHRIKQDNACINRLKLAPGTGELIELTVNDTRHLGELEAQVSAARRWDVKAGRWAP